MQLLFLGTAEMMIVIPVLIFFFYSLFHSATNLSLPVTHRILWFLIVFAIPVLGSIAYWVIGRKPRRYLYKR